MKKIIGIVGSLRKGSLNGFLMNEIKAAFEAKGHAFTIASIADIPLYNQDMEANFPAPVQTLKDQIRASDAIIIATPEYNRSIPGVLKNVIDWTSRPYGQGAWVGKVVATVGASGSATGTIAAQYALKTTLLYMNSKVLGQPEFFLSAAHEKFDQSGVLKDEDTKKKIGVLVDTVIAAV